MKNASHARRVEEVEDGGEQADGSERCERSAKQKRDAREAGQNEQGREKRRSVECEMLECLLFSDNNCIFSSLSSVFGTGFTRLKSLILCFFF